MYITHFTFHENVICTLKRIKRLFDENFNVVLWDLMAFERTLAELRESNFKSLILSQFSVCGKLIFRI